MFKHKKLLLLLVLLLFGGLALYFWYNKSNKTQGKSDVTAADSQDQRKGSGGGKDGNSGKGGKGAKRQQPVSVSPVSEAVIDQNIEAIGTVTAKSTVNLKSRVDGTLIKVHFNEGAYVKAKQLLFELDPRPFQITLDQARGQLTRDQAQLANARLDLSRYQQLQVANAVSRQQIDTQAALVQQLQGTVRVDQAAIDNAQLQLSYSRISAPISGQIGLKQVDVGNIIKANDSTNLAVITATQPIFVVFSVPAEQLSDVTPRWQKGSQFDVEAWDREGKNRLATGKLSAIDNQIDLNTGTIKLKASYANHDNALFPNQFTKVRMIIDRKPSLLVPASAILRSAEGSYVYVVQNEQGASKVAKRSVLLGVSSGLNVVVHQGLSVGELVVSDGTDKLRDGAVVEVIQRNEDRKPAASPQ